MRVGAVHHTPTGAHDPGKTREAKLWYSGARLVWSPVHSWASSHQAMLWRAASAVLEHVSLPAEARTGAHVIQKLFIGGLSFSTSTERLREFFAGLDGVQSVTVVTDRDTGRSRGFGFVEMASPEAAAAAVKKLDGQQLDGRQLKVELSRPSAPRDGRSGGGYRSGGGGSRGRW